MISPNTAIHVTNFKSYGQDGLVIDQLKPVNIIIGRNNIGKSSILDAIEFLISEDEVPASFFHGGNRSEFSVKTQLTQDDVAKVFKPGTSGGWIGGSYWDDVGAHLVGSEAKIRFLPKGNKSMLEFIPAEPIKQTMVHYKPVLNNPNFLPAVTTIAQSAANPFVGYHAVRLSAERDIEPEGRGQNISLLKNGRGITNVIAQVVTAAKYDSRMVEHTMLATINEILYPDIHIDGIRVQEHEGGSWEIFLEQQGKGFIALSNSGSGLKTIILTVASLTLLPILQGKSPEKSIFLLEELENNLHPAMQRRLLSFVEKFVVENNSVAFVTTHSSALIDMFSNKADAQVIHVYGSSGSAIARVADTHVDRSGILDDLDVRASDILQSNGVVWCEGPSDRIYFNKWIEAISGGLLVEGTHYQCVFYGGRLLSHLKAGDESLSSGVQILKVARNAIILIDSDRSSDSDGINNTKERLQAEILSVGGSVWISDGRETENYLEQSTLARLDDRLNRPIGQYEEIEDYLAALLGSEDGKRLIRSKATFAEAVTSVFEPGDILDDSPLKRRLLDARGVIASWNGLALTQFDIN